MDIDFVILWVNGNDPAWQKEKSKYEGKRRRRIMASIDIGIGDCFLIGFAQ